MADTVTVGWGKPAIKVKKVNGGLEWETFATPVEDSTTLEATNLKTSPFGEKEVRALLNFTDTGEPGTTYDKKVYVNWIDDILTKSLVEDLGEGNDEKYGSDPVELANSWVNIAEDGYLTLRIRTLWGRPGQTHVVNLLTGTNPDNPYELELRHDAMGDTCGTMGDALIAFDLNRLVNQDSLSCVRVKLNWLSFSGRKSAEFSFRARPSDGTEGSEKPRGESDNRMGAETGNDEAAILNSFLIR